MAELDELLAVWRENYVVNDLNAIEVMLATVASAAMTDDPIWMFLVGRSGDMKSEMIQTLDLCKGVYWLTSLTSSSLVSGRQRDDKLDLLPKLKGRCLAVQDFTTLLTMDHKERDELFGQLRSAYDGKYARFTGAIGLKAYDDTRFSILGGVTYAIDRFTTMNQDLGERFLKYRLGDRTRLEDMAVTKEMARKKRAGDKEATRKKLREMTRDFLDSKQTDVITVVIPEAIEDEIIAMASVAARARTHVIRDPHRRDIIEAPMTETPNRLYIQLEKLSTMIAHLRGRSEVGSEELAVVRKVTNDCIPYTRLKVLEGVFGAQKSNQWEDNFQGHTDGRNIQTIADLTGIPFSTARMAYEDLEALHILDGEGITSLFRDAFKPS